MRCPSRPDAGPAVGAAHTGKRGARILTATLPQQAFWFLRHGETDWNAQRLAQGSTDVKLNATGRAEARAAAALLHDRGVASIVASPLSRAKDTADVVGRALGLPVEVEPGLREVEFGIYEGQPMAAWFDTWLQGETTVKGGESFARLRIRANAALRRALTRPALVLVVAHGSLFRALRAEMGLPRNVRPPNGMPTFCQPGDPWTLSFATALQDSVP